MGNLSVFGRGGGSVVGTTAGEQGGGVATGGVGVGVGGCSRRRRRGSSSRNSSSRSESEVNRARDERRKGGTEGILIG